MRLHATHRVAQAWLVDVNARRIEVFDEPAPGGYARRRVFGPGESIPLPAAGAYVPPPLQVAVIVG
jgi:Uma2 family endonuclease